jgi:hypothetical protein
MVNLYIGFFGEYRSWLETGQNGRSGFSKYHYRSFQHFWDTRVYFTQCLNIMYVLRHCASYQKPHGCGGTMVEEA